MCTVTVIKTDASRAEHDQALGILQIRAATVQLRSEAMKLPVEVYDPRKTMTACGMRGLDSEPSLRCISKT